MNTKYLMAGSIVLFAMLAAQKSDAQTIFSEDFTGSATTNTWYFFRGACLTASSAPLGTSPGPLPGCLAVKNAYYFGSTGENLVGGTNGVAGNAQTLPDPAKQGALRFTNGAPWGNNEGGAIISKTPFDATNGVQITFKSVTYRGDSLGSAGDGADGISFFMMDGSVTPNIGSEGGSLAYTCSNPNNLPGYNSNGTINTVSPSGHAIIDGVTGGYIGLGIDEYGNFLNGPGDSTATGFGAQGGRIGLRGAGNVSWPYLSTNPATSMYYPASVLNTPELQQAAVAATCKSGYLWDYSNPASPTPVLTGGSTVTGTVSGKVTKNSNTITGIPTPLPLSMIMGATITDPDNYIPANTTITAIGTNTVTMSNSASSSASRNGTAETFTYSSSTPGQNVTILDYMAIPGGYSILSGVQIANENAMSRGAATPIFYNLKITPAGVLSLSYSLSGAAYQSVIANQNITSFNGAMPSTLLFGFAGSTGGATNIHEILCFKAAPQNTSGSSATVNEKESAKVETNTQAFFAFYDPNTWTGTVTANMLLNNAGVVTVSTTAAWDAGCLLNGTAAGTPGPGSSGGCATTGATGPTNPTPGTLARVMMTWDTTNNVGIPFEWTGSSGTLNASQQANLDALDATQTSSRLFYLRGSRTNEVNTAGVGLYRPRASILGDIVDSSPTWVGPPLSPYTATWVDLLHPPTSDAMVENSGTQSYLQYASSDTTVGGELSRLNVVYVGANDGFLHAFRAGSEDNQGNLISNTTTPNDGQEVLAYMPGSTLLSAANTTTSTNCTVHGATQSQVQNIHGVTPIIGLSPLCVDASLDFANPQYGHDFYIDATPGTGDLFYNGTWHTWLVGGLGAGGAAIFALDITNPGNFAEAHASTLVMGEWNPTSINTIGCASTPTTCGGNLGNTFGTPQIRRLHNGQWGVIFGNGFGSSTGDAGIYVMTVTVNGSGKLTPTFYYLSTGQAGGNGIAYTTPVDLDGDHITDYVYAGDLKGNIWRFDLTSASPANWAAASVPLFTAGQPITTQLQTIATSAGGGAQKLLIEFATGQRTQVTNTTPVSFASGTQAIYGVWDWNMSAWNTMSGTQYASLAATTAATGLSSPYTIPAPTTTPATSSLTAQTFTIITVPGTPPTPTGVIDGTNGTVCWQGSTVCTSGNNKFGWYVNLPGTAEQVIFNPVYYQGALIVDSTVPANNTPTSCSSSLDTGFTYILNVANGGVFNNAFPGFINNQGTTANDPLAAGVQTNATGSVYVVTTPQKTSNIIYQTVTGAPGSQEVNIPPNTKSKRLTWVEKR